MGDVLRTGKDFQMRIMLTQQGNGFFRCVRVAHGNGGDMGLFGMGRAEGFRARAIGKVNRQSFGTTA